MTANGGDALRTRLQELIDDWMERARRVRPLESAPITSEKRERIKEWLFYKNRAIELGAVLAEARAPEPPKAQHDSACEAELTSHGYTTCRCEERAAVEGRSPQEPRRRHGFECPECGFGVGVDEDGCCRTCGSDTEPKIQEAREARPAPPLDSDFYFEVSKYELRQTARDFLWRCYLQFRDIVGGEDNLILMWRRDLNKLLTVRTDPAAHGEQESNLGVPLRKDR